jgi:hypothetical protein
MRSRALPENGRNVTFSSARKGLLEGIATLAAKSFLPQKGARRTQKKRSGPKDGSFQTLRFLRFLAAKNFPQIALIRKARLVDGRSI